MIGAFREGRLYFLPNPIMMKRLLQHLRYFIGMDCNCEERRAELDAHSRRLWRDERQDIRVEAFEHRCGCSSPQYFTRISALDPETEQWVPLCELPLESADHVLALLPQAIAE